MWIWYRVSWLWIFSYQLYISLHLSLSVVSNSLWPHGLQHARLPCPSTFRAYSNSCPLSWGYHPTISSSVVPFSSCLLSFPASGSFASGGQNIGVSASAIIIYINAFTLLWFLYFHCTFYVITVHLCSDNKKQMVGWVKTVNMCMWHVIWSVPAEIFHLN